MSLEEVIRHANTKYREGNPVMTDQEYDSLIDELKDKDPNNELLTEIRDDLTTDTRETIKLPFHMPSLNKIKEDSVSLIRWCRENKGPYLVSEKLDGVSAMLVKRRDGEIHMYSRGDGTRGRDISHILSMIDIVDTHSCVYRGLATLPKNTCVRGELVIPRALWKEEWGANARNVVAGMINRKNTDSSSIQSEVCKAIHFVVYQVLDGSSHSISSKALKFISAYLRVVRYKIYESLSKELLLSELRETRINSEYDCDGLVIFTDRQERQERQERCSNPTNGFAFKSDIEIEGAETEVVCIEWRVSKQRLLIPTVVFRSVHVSGVNIERATGFNADFIEKNALGPGAIVRIVRRGDVIPYIESVISPANRPQMPSVRWKMEGVHAVSLEQGIEEEIAVLLHFCKTLEVDGVGEATARRLVEAGIHTPADLWLLHDVAQVLGEGKQSESLSSSLQKTKKRATLLSLAVASNIFGAGVGVRVLETVFKAFEKEICERCVPSLESIMKIDGIGAHRSSKILAGIPQFFEFLELISFSLSSLQENSKSPSEKCIHSSSSLVEKSLSTINAVFTGFRDEKLRRNIELAGGTVSSSVTGRTTHLVTKSLANDHEKIKRARALGICILTKEKFIIEYMNKTA